MRTNDNRIAEKAVEHAVKLDHLQAEMTTVIARLDALPSIIAVTMAEVLDARDKRRAQ